MPLIYIPKSLGTSAPTENITALYICAYPATGISSPTATIDLNSSDPRMTNHWVVCFYISPTMSIRFDPSPTGPNSLIDLIISSETKPHVHLEGYVKVTRLTPAEGLTVGLVIDQITNSKFDHYQFSTSGQGCRYWLCSLAGLFLSLGLVTNGDEVNAVSSALQVVWDDEEGEPFAVCQQTGMTIGTFPAGSTN